MRVKLQLVICHDDGQEETVTDIISLHKNNQRIEHLGLSLDESKQLLSTLQRHLLQQQVTTFLDVHATCPDCGTSLKLKERGSKSFRTLFSTFKFYSPRLEYCDCKRRKTASFRPLSALLTEPVAPELLYMEAKWSSLVSYGLSLDALQDFLPIDLNLDVKTVRYDTLKVAKRLEAELGEEQTSFIEGEPPDWDLLPPPEGVFKVGIDGGYIRNWFDKKHQFEVIVGKSILSFAEDEEDKTPSLKRFGFVQTLDTKSKRRLYEVLHAQDLQMNQTITFLSDGDDTLRQLQLEMSPNAIHILDWFHLTMRLTVLSQYGKGLVQCEAMLGEAICDQIERLKWSLWHGQVDKALSKIDDLETSIEPFSGSYTRYAGLVKALSELRTYIVNNRHLIPNYGECYRNGEPIATGFVESTVNEVVSKRFCKKQQMQWSKEGAHLLLQTRVRVLNGELAGIFKRWYPDLDIKAEEIPMAAQPQDLPALANQDGPVGDPMLVTGWGRTSEGGTSPIMLQAVQVPLVDATDCNDANSYNGQITDRMICARLEAGGQDSCQGDSGGPLTRGLNNAVLTGIVSWGFGCARPNLYGVYTRVSAPGIRQFIEGIVPSPTLSGSGREASVTDFGTTSNVVVTVLGTERHLWGSGKYADVRATADAYCQGLGLGPVLTWEANACGEDESSYIRYNPDASQWEFRSSGSANNESGFCRYPLLTSVACGGTLSRAE